MIKHMNEWVNKWMTIKVQKNSSKRAKEESIIQIQKTTYCLK